MNYRFLSTLALVICMYTGVKANHSPKAMEKPQVVPSRLKIGYVDVDYILDNLPETKKNSAEIQSFEKQLNNQIKTRLDEYQVKVEAFQQQVDTLTEAQAKQKKIEIQDLACVIHGLEDRKPAQIAEKYKAVMQPLHDKMHEVIKEVAEKHAYTFVLSKNTEVGFVVLFAQKSLDLSELVLEKLKAMALKEVQPPVVGSKAPLPAKAAPTKKSVKNK